MPAPTKIVDRDHGWNRAVREVRRRPADVMVGVQGTKAEEKHEGSDRTVAEILSDHEFGITNPRRSFLRDWFDEQLSDLRRINTRLATRVVEGKITLEQASEQLGAKMVGLIQKRWRDGIPPPLDERTIDRKGSAVPLIDTGQSRSSVGYKVEGKATEYSSKV